MSTCSYIAIQRDENQYEMIYCHWDGYPDHNGFLLQRYYDTEEKVNQLIEGGDMSALADCVENCFYYARDKKEPFEDVAPVIVEFSDLFVSGIEFTYIFTDKWICYDHKQNIVEIPTED